MAGETTTGLDEFVREWFKTRGVAPPDGPAVAALLAYRDVRVRFGHAAGAGWAKFRATPAELGRLELAMRDGPPLESDTDDFVGPDTDDFVAAVTGRPADPTATEDFWTGAGVIGGRPTRPFFRDFVRAAMDTWAEAKQVLARY